jgi:hypothetical protein
MHSWKDLGSQLKYSVTYTLSHTDTSGLAREPTYKLNFVGSQAKQLAPPFSQRRRMLIGVRCPLGLKWILCTRERHALSNHDFFWEFASLIFEGAHWSRVYMRACVQRCECTCVVSVCVVLCNLKKSNLFMCLFYLEIQVTPRVQFPCTYEGVGTYFDTSCTKNWFKHNSTYRYAGRRRDYFHSLPTDYMSLLQHARSAWGKALVGILNIEH